MVFSATENNDQTTIKYEVTMSSDFYRLAMEFINSSYAAIDENGNSSRKTEEEIREMSIQDLERAFPKYLEQILLNLKNSRTKQRDAFDNQNNSIFS